MTKNSVTENNKLFSKTLIQKIFQEIQEDENLEYYEPELKQSISKTIKEKIKIYEEWKKLSPYEIAYETPEGEKVGIIKNYSHIYIKEWIQEIFNDILSANFKIIRHCDDMNYLILTIKSEDILYYKKYPIAGIHFINFFKKEKLEKIIDQKDNILYGCKLFVEIKKDSVDILFRFANENQYGNVIIYI